MQPGQAGGQQKQQQQAVWQAQQQADQQRHWEQRRSRQRQKRQAQYPGPFVPSDQQQEPGSLAPSAVRARSRLSRVAGWVIAAVAVLWVIAIATHVESVRQHDGPITPVPYILATVGTVLAAGLLLALFLRVVRRPESIAGRDGGSVQSRAGAGGAPGASGAGGREAGDEWHWARGQTTQPAGAGVSRSATDTETVQDHAWPQADTVTGPVAGEGTEAAAAAGSAAGAASAAASEPVAFYVPEADGDEIPGRPA